MTTNDVTTTVIESVAGHDVLPLVEVLKGKKNVSEFTIAEALKEEINTIRNKLYRLYDFSLVEFTRKKDKKKGWYIYYWTFVPSKVPFLMKEMKRKKLDKLKERLKAEQNNNFFSCSNECVRLSFEKAMDFEFKCPECGSLMNQEDTTKRIEHIINEIHELEKEIRDMPEIVIETPIETEEEIAEEIKPIKKHLSPLSSPSPKISKKPTSKKPKRK